ncbi:MAG TPA: PEP-CTERM sorting domain-containing protein [Verrucomicrobiota bacterium]|nr:PEP-CTERM sorting domain-containing protein [Verrucomicrobiota bacterium]HQL79571.1 PEP-CTERM sorting domain-containing protein [Verrucomicrobiota bacterium]
MKNLIQTAAVLLLAAATASGQIIIADKYDVTGSDTGFALGSGVNSGINPPATRMTGSLAANMSYLYTFTDKAAASYSITGNALKVAAAGDSGRFTLSADGTTAYDFGPVLQTGSATAANPIVYDITISMANNSAAQQRFSFALATVENNANFWDFGVQLFRTNNTMNRHTIGKRIDRVSYTTAIDSTGPNADLNKVIARTPAGSYGAQVDFLMRVTDAGAESTTFNSRVQLSMDGGSNWFYDTQSDADLSATGFRFDTNSRYFSWDIADQASAAYDNFSLTLVTPAVPEPSTLALGLLAGVGALIRRRR